MAANGKYASSETLLYFKQKLDQIFAKITDIPTKLSQLANDAGFITSAALDPYAKTADLPTNVSDLTNDAGYQNSSQVDRAITSKGYQTATQVDSAITAKGYQNATQVQQAINTALSGFTGIDFQIVESLPGSGVKGTIYLLSNGGSGNNSYDEYVYINQKWEKIGTTDIDLSNYYNTTNFTAITNGEIDAIFA